MKLPIYMDHHATTPVDPRVLDAMLPYFTEVFGNPASRSHRFGWKAEEAVEKAREQVATGIGASPKEIVFTSGATESNNLALKGALDMYAERGHHVVTVATEHKSILDTCKSLQRKGAEVTVLPVSSAGLVSPEDVRAAITDRTVLVSVMHANNEIGVLQPIAEIGALCHERGVLFHVDAAQSVGKVPFDVNADHVDLASVSAHKLYGPKGAGALYVRRKGPRVRLAPLIEGGGHERGMRSGTLPVPLLVGFGAAVELAAAVREEESRRLLALRTRLHDGLVRRVPEVFVNGDLDRRLPGNLNMSFAYVEGESLLMGITDIAVSSGSACTSASLEPSYVLQALGVSDALAHTSIRFGLGRSTTEEEVDYAIDKVASVVERLRSLSPLWEMAQEGVDINSVKWSQVH